MVFICNKPIEECEDCKDIVEMAKEIAINDRAVTILENAFANLIIKLMLEKGIQIDTDMIYG